MSLGTEVKDRMTEQVVNQAARNIFTHVRDAQNVELSSSRWIWELLQNAVDSAVETGEPVDVSFTHHDGRLVVEHNGGPFSVDNLAALITGGSSKPYASERYIGQFGTGFLVTHVLSAMTTVEGLVLRSGAEDRFRFDLDRNGSIDEIRQNIELCFQQLDGVLGTADGQRGPAARFTYYVGNSDQRRAMTAGWEQLAMSIGYVFGFARLLRSVTVDDSDDKISWERKAVSDIRAAAADGIDRISVARRDSLGETTFVVLVARDPVETTTGCAVLVDQGVRGPTVVPPKPEAPRIFRQYPLIGSAGLGLPVVISALFDVDEERRELYLKEEKTRMVAQRALHLLPGLAQYVATSQTSGAHHLMTIRPATAVEMGENQVWWNDQLKQVAHTLAELAIVELSDGSIVAPMQAQFPSPFLNASSHEELDFEALWKLSRQYLPRVPRRDHAYEWQKTVRGWGELDPRLRCLYVENIAADVKSQGNVTSLAIMLKLNTEESVHWLQGLFDLMAEYEAKRKEFPQNLLNGLIPTQNDQLASPLSVKRDPGIDRDLKQFAVGLGVDVRGELVKRALFRGLSDRTSSFLNRSIQGEKSEADLLQQLIAQTLKLTQTGKKVGPNDALLIGSIHFLGWLARKPADFAEYAQRVPVLTKAGDIRTHIGEPSFLLPEHFWPDKARQYSPVFPDVRILHGVYASAVDGGTAEMLAEAFVQWGMTHGRCILAQRLFDIDERRLQYFTVLSQNDSHRLSGVRCSYIPFLNEIIGATSQDRQRAARLFGFLAEYCVDADLLWKESTTVLYTSNDQSQGNVQIYPSEWLATIRSSRWVASEPDENGQTNSLQATSEVIKLLIKDWEALFSSENTWAKLLSSLNTIEFLGRLGFDRLELQLRTLAGSDSNEIRKIKDTLADILAETGSDGLGEFQDLIRERREKRGKIKRNRDLGFHIQNLIRDTLTTAGFGLDVIDRGYDFRVYPSGEPDDADIDVGVIEVGEYFVEVKATTTDEARMTTAQATYAVQHPDTYVLCVVDLRLLQKSTPWDELESHEIRPATSIVADIGRIVTDTHDRLEYASEEANNVRLKNVQQLRYGVKQDVWLQGISIADWINKIRPRVRLT